jgi:asparagine synthase (glutamine-hydrolysing)
MDELLFHRGPDENGMRTGALGTFGMRRLSIVDLAGGHQPMANEDGTVWIVFNGEIYNHEALRAELVAAGHRFATRSDTEVIVHGYEVWGDAVVERLRGMFAFAVVDERRRRVLFARDHIGKKPLYLWARDGRLVFASELKAIVADPSFVKRLDREAFWHYLTFKNVTPPLCIYEGVVQLPPATRAVWDDSGLRMEPFWRPSFGGDSEIGEDEAAHQILVLLREAVRRRLFVADVPVGAYLSGGVDSSLVVGIASELMSRPLDTFSLGYKEQITHKSDVGFARQMAERFGTNHHELFIGVDDIVDGIPAVIDSFDEPFGAVTSTYYLSELIRRHVKVAVTGDGADELFGSYANHRMAAVVEHLRAVPTREEADFGTFARRRDLALRCAEEPDYLWRTRFAGFADAEKLALVPFGASMPASSERLRGFYDDARGDAVNRALEVDCRTLLPDQILTYVDRLSMAHSVEARAPFLDLDLIEFVGRLPSRFKVTLGESKRILKRAARAILPAEILDRPKEGFVLPIDAWLNDKLRPLVEEVSSPRWLRHGLFDRAGIAAFVAEHQSGAADHTYKLWTFVNFQLWYARCMDSSYGELPLAQEIVRSA